MKYNEAIKRELLALLNDKAFKSSQLDYKAIEQISIELRIIPVEEKYKFHDYVKEFLDKVFSLGLGDNNIRIEDFHYSKIEDKIIIIPEIENQTQDLVKENSILEINNEKIDTAESFLNFNDLFQKLQIALKDYFEFFKGYYVLKLLNNPTKKFKLIFLYDTNYFFDPLKKKISKDLKYVEFIEIKDFHNKIDYDVNYLCVVLLNTKPNDKDGLNILIENLSKIIRSFEDFDNYTFYKNEKGEIKYKKSNVIDDFFDEIETVNKSFLSNTDLSFAEEKIIKKLCSVNTPLILYSVLTKGYSGAKVLEVRPKVSANFNIERKFIIKYDLLEKKKLKQEYDNFSLYISSLKGFKDYTGDYAKTLTHEGIKYNYAISDYSEESYSFNDVIKNSDNIFYSTKKEKIDKLFSIKLFEEWKKEHFESKTAKVKNIFSRFINQDKIIIELKNILCLNDDEILKNELIIDFNNIWKHEIKYNEKICHGDLHTDNFFIDNTNVFLIDFGFTGKHHSLIDYTALECSLKFKHFPRYLESDELIKIENELILERSFDFKHSFSSTKRTEILEILEMINTVRHNSIKDFDNGSNLDYFISLFIMTFRQIQYPNMNQFYAYHSATILSKEIVKLLGI